MSNEDTPYEHPPQNGRLSVRDIVHSLESIHGDIRILSERQSGILQRLTYLDNGVENLHKHVVHGNGEPGLLQRVTQLETHRAHDSIMLQNVASQVNSVDTKLDTAAEAHMAQITTAKEAHATQIAAINDGNRSARSERIGWGVAIVVGVLGLIGAVIQGIMPGFLGK